MNDQWVWPWDSEKTKSLDVVRWETDKTVEVVFAKYEG